MQSQSNCGSSNDGSLRRDLADDSRRPCLRVQCHATAGAIATTVRRAPASSAQAESALSQRNASDERDRASADRQRRRCMAARRGSWSARSASRKWSCTPPAAGRPSRFFSLVEHEQHRSAEREADDDRVRDVARQVAQPQQRDADLDRRRP